MKTLAQLFWNGLSKEPIWSDYDAFELAPVIEENGECRRLSVEEFEALPSGDDAFWTVYGHCCTGGVEALRDCVNEAEAKAVMALAESELAKVVSDSYVKFGGTVCPNYKCSSGNIESNCFDVKETGHAEQECFCHDCGTEWTDNYKLTSCTVDAMRDDFSK